MNFILKIMLFKSSVHLLVYFSISFILNKLTYSMKYFSKRDASDYEPKCLKQDTAVDQAHYYNNNSRSTRSKRFVLFPEFINYLDDWRYIHRPQQFIYWIANFYPNKINTDDIHRYIKTIIQQINSAIDQDIIVQEASNPGEANFHFNFFDYTKCPMDDIPEANVDNILVLDELFIYPPEVTKQNRYRAHGGIHLIEDDRPISTIKLNMQHKFLVSNDFVYEPTIYACTEDEEDCEIDLYYVLLHETLHGFGIEVNIYVESYVMNMITNKYIIKIEKRPA